MAVRWAETGIFNALETQILDTVSGGSVLDGLQLLDWPQGSILSSNDSFTADGCIPEADWHLPEWGCQSPSPEAASAHYKCVSPLLSLSASNTTDEVLLCPAPNSLPSRGSGDVTTSGSFTDYNASPQQSHLLMGVLPLEAWGTSTESPLGCHMVAKAPSAQLVTDSCLPLTGLQLDMRALSSPAELQTYDGWMGDIPDIPTTSVQLPGSDTLTRSWSLGMPAQEDAIVLPKRAASTGSDESLALAVEQALPLSHADLALLPSNKWLPSLTSLAPLISLPSALQITPLSSGPVPEALKGFTMAPSHQEPQGILKVPSLPNFSLACLLDQAPDKESMGLPAAADMLLLPSLGLPARLCPQEEGPAAAVPEKAPKAQAKVTAGMAGNQAQPAKLALASWTRTVEAQGAAQPSENSLVDPEQPDKEFGMPMVPKQAAGPTRPARHAARRANARVALVEDSSEDSDWERGSAPQRSRCARRRSPKEETEPVPEAVARNRITQRQYLQRKKGKVAAMHAHVPELEARLAQLQAEVAPLVERHQILSDQLPWKQQLEEVQFMASLGDFQEAMPPGNVRTRATFLQRYAEDPLAACTSILGQHNLRQPNDCDTRTAGLPRIKVASVESMHGADADDVEQLHAVMPEVLVKLRLSKSQKDQLAEQGREIASVKIMQSEGCDSIAVSLQSTLTGSVESMHLGWRCSLLTHVLCGELAGLAQHGADVDERSIALCAEVLSASQEAKLAHLTSLHPSACAALCMEVRCQKAGLKLPWLLPAAPKVPRAAQAPKARILKARMLTMTDIGTAERAANGRHATLGVCTGTEGEVITSGALDCSAAKTAAASVVTDMPAPVEKRKRAAGFEEPSHNPKKAKGDEPLIKRTSSSRARMVTSGAVALPTRLPRRPAARKPGSCPSPPSQAASKAKPRAQKYASLTLVG